MERKGSASTAAAAAVQTRCRAAADRPRNKKAAIHAAPSTTVLLSATPMHIANHADWFQPVILFALSLCFFDHCRHAVQFLARERSRRNVQESSHDLLRRPVKVGLEKMFDGYALGLFLRHF